MDFINYINDILAFIQTTLPTYLGDIAKPNKYVDDYFDTDKYKDNIVLYLTPDSEFNFEELSNESKLLNHSLDVFVTFKGDKESSLKALSKSYLESFYQMIKENPSLGRTVDYSMIETIRYYDGIEGQQNGKAIYLRLKILCEK